MSDEKTQIVETVVNSILPMSGGGIGNEDVVRVVSAYANGQTNKATGRCDLRLALQKLGKVVEDDRLELCNDTAFQLVCGHRNWVNDQGNSDVLDFYPARELIRFYENHVETVNWIERWTQNGGQLFQGKRMIALARDPIWTRISFFGLPFPPFDLDSGMDVQTVDRADAEVMGLIGKGETISPDVLNLDFGTALKQRVEHYFSIQGRYEKLENAVDQSNPTNLFWMAKKLMDSAEEITEELAIQVVPLITKALELGFGQDFQKESEAHELLAEIHDVAGENEQANCARKKRLASLQAWIAKGIPIDFNQRANAYAHMAGVCEQLGQTDQAAEYQLLTQENRDGFTLLNEALEELRSLEGRIEKETGAKILDKLSKAAGRIPEKFPERHAEVYRATGEILEAWGDTEQAVEYFEYALQKNPKVGVKRRLESLKKTT